MRTKLPFAILAIILILSSCYALAARAEVNDERTEIPINLVTIRGVQRYWINLTINQSKALPVAIDSGSGGLVVLKSWPNLSSGTPTSPEYTSVYGDGKSGFVLRLKNTTATLQLGSNAKTRSVDIGLVENAACQTANSTCETARTKSRNYLFLGDGVPGAGFQAIMGIGPDGEHTPNPLFSFAETWIIELPSEKSKVPGRLILNPNTADLEGFKIFEFVDANRVGKPVMMAGLPGCLFAQSKPIKVCGTMHFDTGAARYEVYSNDKSTFGLLANAGSYRLEIGEAENKMTWEFKAAKSEFEYNDHFKAQNVLEGIFIHAKSYQIFSAYYDLKHNRMGLKPR